MTSLFPLIKRFADAKKSHSTAILTEDTVIYNKCFRAGTVFFISGWREIAGQPFLIITKGSWEALVSYFIIEKIMEPLNDR